MVSSSDFSKKTIQHLMDNSLAVLDVVEPDNLFSLADKELHPKLTKEIDIYYPCELDFESMIHVTQEAEHAARDYDQKITNSEGATLNYSSSLFLYANSIRHEWTAYLPICQGLPSIGRLAVHSCRMVVMPGTSNIPRTCSTRNEGSIGDSITTLRRGTSIPVP